MVHIVWASMLDERYECFVKREGEYLGILHIWDSWELNYLHITHVYLPTPYIGSVDRARITEWEDMCMNFIDNCVEVK